MGTRTLVQLEEELTGWIGGITSSTVTSAQKRLWLNRAYRHVAFPSVYRHPELQATQDITVVTSDSDYSLETDLWAVGSVYNVTRGRRLLPRNIIQFDEEIAVEGEPVHYALYGHDGAASPTPRARTLHVRDIPSSTYSGDTLRVRYWQRPDELTQDEHTTVIAPDFDEALLFGGKWRCWVFLGAEDRARAAREDFENYVNEIPDPFQIEGEDPGARVEVIVEEVMPY